jgi:hypothetical protein
MANTKVTGDLIASLTIATGNIADNAVTSDKISGITTAHVTEGSNLYYTDARARGAVSVSGNALSYNSSTGVITSNFEESPVFTGDVTIGDNKSIISNGSVRIDIDNDNNSTTRAFLVRNNGGTNTLFRVQEDGNVGIGTTDPAAKLEVKENLYVSHPNAEELTFRIDNYGTTGTDAGSLLRMFNQAGTTVVNIDSRSGSTRHTYFNQGGNVGIGTTNPTRDLTIGDGSGNSVLAIVAATNGLSQIGLGDSDDDNYGQIILRHSDGLLQIQNGGGGGISERGLNITSSENVGIGETSPPQKLTVNGGVFITDDITSPGSAGTYTYNGTAIDYASNGTRYWSWGSGTARGTFNFIQLENDGTNQQTALSINSSGNSTFAGNVGIGSAASSTHTLDLNSSSNLALRFYDSTTFKAGMQAVDTGGQMISSSADGDFAIRSQSNMLFSTGGNTERMRIDSSGQVQVKATSGGDLLLYSTDTSLGSNQLIGRLGFYKSDASGAGAGVSASIQVRSQSSIGANSYMSFHTDGGDGQQEAERMRIDRTGKVGIGTTLPNVKLEISENQNPSLRFNNEDLSVVSGDTFGTIEWYTNDPSSSGTGIAATIRARAASSFTGSNRSTNITFSTASGTTAPTERMRIDSSGNVRIGTEQTLFNGNSKLQIARGNSPSYIQFISGNLQEQGILFGDPEDTVEGSIRYVHDGDYMWFQVNNTEKMRIDSSGTTRLLKTQVTGSFDTTSFLRLHPSTTINNGGFTNMFFGTSELDNFGISLGGLRAGTDGTPTFIIKTHNNDATGVERMRITSGGDVEITGGYTSSQSFQSTGSLRVSSNSTATNGNVALELMNDATGTRYLATFTNYNGVVGSISTYASATSYNTSSDYRLKENVVEMTGALDRVSQLKPSRFNFIADADKTVDGFLAHEVQEIVPEAITGEKDAVNEEGNPEYQGIDQSKLVPLLVGAIQEQQEIINDLKADIELLKTQINN